MDQRAERTSWPGRGRRGSETADRSERRAQLGVRRREQKQQKLPGDFSLPGEEGDPVTLHFQGVGQEADYEGRAPSRKWLGGKRQAGEVPSEDALRLGRNRRGFLNLFPAPPFPGERLRGRHGCK